MKTSVLVLGCLLALASLAQSATGTRSLGVEGRERRHALLGLPGAWRAQDR